MGAANAEVHDAVAVGDFEKSKSIVKEHMYWAMGLGLIPIPLVDLVAISATQLKLVHRLAKHHEVCFVSSQGKAFVAALTGSLGSQALARGVGGSLVKLIPFVGTYAGVITLPVLAGASTYAIGMVFNQHFASGGTFLDFDPETVREHYEECFEKGKEAAADAQDKGE